MTAIGKLLPNTSGPRGAKRLTLVSVCKSVLCYAAPVWGGAMNIQSYRKMLETVWRRALIRAICGYRTVSKDAADAVGGQLPIQHEIKLRITNYLDKRCDPELYNPKQNWDAEVKCWQRERTSVDNDAWTRRILPDVRTWTMRKHAFPNHNTTQVLTGHGAFNEYLHRFRVANSELCQACQVTDTAEHAVFHCALSHIARRSLNDDIGADISTENLCLLMCETETKWNRICEYIDYIMTERSKNERDNRNPTIANG